MKNRALFVTVMGLVGGGACGAAVGLGWVSWPVGVGAACVLAVLVGWEIRQTRIRARAKH
jgi:hypothetical protein